MTNIFILVHGDMWGAFNANKLVKAVADHGANPILIVSRSTPGEDGYPATKIPALRIPRILKENAMLQYFAAIDQMPKKYEPYCFTFGALAEKYCLDAEIHFTSCGGFKGGEEIGRIFADLEARGITPDLVLSGDTLAILPEDITLRYPCFGTHPAPLPEIAGMQGTARSVLNNIYYDYEGKRLPENHIFGDGLAYVQGSVFQLHPELDKGPIIDTAHAPFMPGMCFYQLRSDLYDALTSRMLEHLPTLLDPAQREALLDQAVQKTGVTGTRLQVPNLDEAALDAWLAQGTIAIVQETARLEHAAPGVVVRKLQCEPEYLPNAVLDLDYFASSMRLFFPADEQIFQTLFDKYFYAQDKSLAQKFGSNLEL